MGLLIAIVTAPVAKVGPAALASTFLTSAVGAVTYALLALTTSGNIAPIWSLGLACGLGGLIGGYLGLISSPGCPNRFCVCCWGGLAMVVGGLYAVQLIK